MPKALLNYLNGNGKHKHVIFRTKITIKGVTYYAHNYGLKAFPIYVD